MLNSDGTIKERRPDWNTKSVISSLNTFCQLDTPEFEFHTALSNHVYVQYRSAAVVSTSKKGNAVDAKTLAKRWNIGIETAERTIECTTQRGIRTILHPTLSRRFRTNDRQLRYRRIAHDLFTDTLEATVPSWFRQNWYAQVFATRFG